MNSMTTFFRKHLAAYKGIPPKALCQWETRELTEFCSDVIGRWLRGLVWRLRFRRAEGLILCQAHVRIHHAAHISAGAGLNLEEGCQIIGLSEQGITFGKRCTVGRFASIRPTNLLVDEVGKGMRMGDHSNIGAYSYVGCSGLIEIGSHVMMGPRVNLLAENHRFDDVRRVMQDQGTERSFIRIEDDCWIGAGCTILAGVTVHKGSVIAAGAIVTHDVPPFTVVAGVPAKVKHHRTTTDIL